ncbi:hypothetical protein D3C72_1891200 [compost metagenome]
MAWQVCGMAGSLAQGEAGRAMKHRLRSGFLRLRWPAGQVSWVKTRANVRLPGSAVCMHTRSRTFCLFNHGDV